MVLDLLDHIFSEYLVSNNSVLSIDNYLSGTKENHVAGVEYIRGGSSKDILDLAGNFSADNVFHLGEYSGVESSFDDYELVIDNNLVPFSRKFFFMPNIIMQNLFILAQVLNLQNIRMMILIVLMLRLNQ